jgi:hypothetical protein
MEEKELEQLREEMVDEMAQEIYVLSRKDGPVNKVQPPESVIELAAQAAASVLMAFERGYQMD